MTSRLFHLTLTLAATLIVAVSALAAEKRHQFIEPIQPDRRQQERNAGPASTDKLCYCRTVHERNAVGQVTWKVVCSDKGPVKGTRQIRARDCRALRNLPPS
ncbi:exported hypothetical protein [uncultured Pleomorphomonas sp.]|uniref:Uncharacterized protein n=1 Tax=uncultured Pleomorphomonas sp. TaxID=442121 RepID=A0A212LAV0_9HYPH|nr:hypothetical protein [uncultured Pleomorphomonas sp.]SCM74655.1 exported hypothetical protein [uncultured Pleomorphomonas sp.]